MSRARHRDAPYWVHSDPEQPAGPPAAAEPALTGQDIAADLAALTVLADTACRGPCNRRWRTLASRALAELERALTEPDRPPSERILARVLTPAQKAPVWCPTCSSELTTALGRLPDLAAACGARRDGQLAPPPPSERHATAVAPPSPSPAWDQVDLIVRFTLGYADRLARHLALPDPFTYDPAGIPRLALSGTVAWLIGHKAALLSAPFAETFGRELRDLVYRSEKLAGKDALVHRVPEACFVCGREALTRRDGADRVVCGNCGRDWPSHLFDYLAHRVVAATHTSRTPQG